MRTLIKRWFVNALGLYVASWLIGGVHLNGGFVSVLIVALVFGIVHTLLKPVLVILSIPLLIVTLGLFAFVVNGALLLITAAFTSSLVVDGLWAAVLGSLVISVVTSVLNAILDDDEKVEKSGW